MKSLRQLLLTGLVWLTAGMTLVAGTPHFQCKCPNGTVKPFCIRTMLGLSTDCCVGNCCCLAASSGRSCCGGRGNATDVPEKQACCHKGALPVAESESDCKHVRTPGCVKTLAPQQPFMDSVEQKFIFDASHALPVLATIDTFNVVPFTADIRAMCARLDHDSSPSDLVVTLQRFVI